MVARQTIGGTRRLGLQFAIGMLLLILPMQAQAGVVGVGVTGKAGTTGLGGDLTIPIVSNFLNLRAGYNFGELRPSVTEAGIKYKGDLHFESIPILLDLHPFSGGFRITGGVFHNKNDMDLSSFLAAGSEIGGATTPVNTTLNANVSWSKEWAPYLGIGWGNAAEVDPDSSFSVGFSLDVGAFYQGSPDVFLTESTGLVPASEIAAEQAQIEDDLSSFKFFPVLTLGIHIRF